MTVALAFSGSAAPPAAGSAPSGAWCAMRGPRELAELLNRSCCWSLLQSQGSLGVLESEPRAVGA